VDTADRLKERMRVARDEDVVLGMFFHSVLARLSQTAGEGKAEDVRQRVLGTKRIVGFFRYPVVDLLRIMDAGASTVEQPYGRSMEDYGRSAVQFFFDSPIGRTLLKMTGSDPHRITASAPPSYRACSSYGECRYEKSGEHAAVLCYRGELLGPAAQAGVVAHALKMTCKVDPKLDVAALNTSGTDFDIRIQW
jgi:uncharacterized protein (TIGR02265 family)